MKIFLTSASCVTLVGMVMALLSGIPTANLAVAREPLVMKIRGFRGESGIDPAKEYKYQLLELILNKTLETDGPFRIEVVENIVQSRVIEMVNQGELSLIVTMTSQEREQILFPIRIPVYKGLYGYRAFIINARDRERFAAIRTVEELKQLWAGQGHDWPDLKILEANGFNTVAGSSYVGLFGMLREGRFDYFPRGLHEPWKEVEEHPGEGLMVEQHLILQYPAPGYIFVAKDNIALADRLERGFRAAIADGSFDRFFRNHPDVATVLKRANLKERRIFRIPNPLLSPETPLDREEFWYAP